MSSTLATPRLSSASLLNSERAPQDSREQSPPRVGVLPPAALHSHRRLLSALEGATEVRFVPGRSNPDRLDGALLFPGAGEHAGGLPERLPRHSMERPEAGPQEAVTVSMSGGPALPQPVRGQLLREAHAPSISLSPSAEPPLDVLATADSAAIWRRERGPTSTRSLLAPAELEDGEPLRERLRDGRFLALLPLLWFLRSLYAGAQWQAPPMRASFIFDDPNLRAFTYGFLDFRELAAWTKSRGTHVTFAMVPLDGRFAARRVVELFRRSPGLSLMVHGNNHSRHELGRDWAPNKRLGMLEQALARIESFELRTGLRVPHVMAPPHGQCSEETADGMRRLGFEALCVSRPYPWLAEQPRERPQAGWGISEIVAGGLPVMPRLSLAADPRELIFRALLGQPLIAYGHHADVAEGLDSLISFADVIDRLGEVRWCSPGEIARSNYSTRIVPNGLELRPYSRLLDLEVPAGCTTLRISPPEDGQDLTEHRPRWRRAEPGATWNPVSSGEDVPVKPGARIQIALGAPALRGLSRAGRLTAAGAVARRAATEMRDRIQPIGRRPTPGYR
jgi:hypothetical protein